MREASWVLTAIAGSDARDSATTEADGRKVDYAAALNRKALRGARIGVMRFALSAYSSETRSLFERAVQQMRAAGAEIIDIEEAPAEYDKIGNWEFQVLATEFKHGLNAYLASTRPDQVKARTLGQLLAFNAAQPREMQFFGQETFERAEAAPDIDDPAYLDARSRAHRAAGPDGIDRMMSRYRVVALIAPTTSRAATLDRNDADRMQGSISQLPAVAGYPHLTVPMGRDRGMPVGISFIAGKWQDASVLSLGYAFEYATRSKSGRAQEWP